MSEPVPGMHAKFLGDAGGRVLAVQFNPSKGPRAHIVYVPPFGEEMNRCRALVAAQARQFAQSGYSCTLLDLYGTGDSEGELYEANLAIWYENIACLIDNLQREIRAPIILWGVRLGGLLALDFSHKSEVDIQNLILWHPVTSGKRFVTQMLRQRVASMVGKGEVAETTSEIRQRLEAGELVEISGYTVGRELLRDLEAIDLSGTAQMCSGDLYWLENVSDPEQSVSTSTQKMIDRLVGCGEKIQLQVFTDPPIWQLHKRDSAPELMKLTGGLLL